MKVISGGQSGSDLGALIAAKEIGLETGGYVPKHFLTEEGFKPEYAELYNLKEISVAGKKGYVVRTYKNVEESDATIRMASNFESPGEVCTKNAILKYNKPYLDIDINNPPPVETVVKFIKDNNIQVLNVAGNRESKSPGIGEFVKDYMLRVLNEICIQDI